MAQHYPQRPASATVIPSGARRHVQVLDLDNNGTVVECVILKAHSNGDRIFIRVDHMDEIDKARIRSFLAEPHADKFELWDLLSQRHLKNGMNALEYFHQLARHYIAATKKVILPNASVMGVGRPGPMGPGRAIVK